MNPLYDPRIVRCLNYWESKMLRCLRIRNTIYYNISVFENNQIYFQYKNSLPLPYCSLILNPGITMWININLHHLRMFPPKLHLAWTIGFWKEYFKRFFLYILLWKIWPYLRGSWLVHTWIITTWECSHTFYSFSGKMILEKI